MATRAHLGRMVDRVPSRDAVTDDGYCLDSEITHVRITKEGNFFGGREYVWSLDGANADGSRYSEAVWTFDKFEDAVAAVESFLRDNAPHLLDNKMGA